MSRPIKVGLAVDNWKIPEFEKALKAEGFKWEAFPFTAKTTILQVQCRKKDADRLGQLCARLVSYLFHKKTAEN